MTMKGQTRDPNALRAIANYALRPYCISAEVSWCRSVRTPYIKAKKI